MPPAIDDIEPTDAPLSRTLAPASRLSVRALGKDGRLLLSICVIVAIALAASLFMIREAQNRLLKSEATRVAVHWAQFLQSRLNGLDEILSVGLVSESDRRTLDFASAAGRVRNYQVIRPDGIVALSSWSGDFRGAIDLSTVLSVIRDERILTQMIVDDVPSPPLVVGQAYVPLRAATGLGGALKVDVDMTDVAERYRDIGNSAFALLIVLLLLPGVACGWLILRNIRARQRGELLQRQRSEVLEYLASGIGLEDVLLRIARFAERHYGSARCVIVALDRGSRGVRYVVAPSDPALNGRYVGVDSGKIPRSLAAALHEDRSIVIGDAVEGEIWSTPMRATSGAVLGAFSLVFPRGGAEAAEFGPGGMLAQLAAMALEYRHAESDLAEMRQRHELILNAAGDGIFGVDAKGRVVFINPAAARMLGRDVGQTIGADAVRLVRAGRVDGSADFAIGAALAGGDSYHVDQINLRRADGSEFSADLMVTTVERAGSTLRAVVVFHDISTQIQTQQQLFNAKEVAETASRAKSNFLANMSHELRTPLNAIIGFSEVMKSEMVGPLGNDQYVSYAEDIHSSGRHLLDLINDLLDLSKIEAGKFELFEEAVDLNALVGECVVLVRDAARSGGLTLETHVAPSLPAVLCDEQKLKQVVVNLLSNATKFTPEGGRVGIAARLDPQDTIVIEVADTGVGIEPALMEKVMMPFGQADEAFNRKHKGTGLGLPLSKALVELHGGSLTIDSAPGKGTTVAIRLPGRATEPACPIREIRAASA